MPRSTAAPRRAARSPTPSVSGTGAKLDGAGGGVVPGGVRWSGWPVRPPSPTATRSSSSGGQCSASPLPGPGHQPVCGGRRAHQCLWTPPPRRRIANLLAPHRDRVRARDALHIPRPVGGAQDRRPHRRDVLRPGGRDRRATRARVGEPAHPYTRALIGAIPKPGAGRHCRPSCPGTCPTRPVHRRLPFFIPAARK